MPQIGEIANQQEIGLKGKHKMIWAACEDCRKERWVALIHGKPQNVLCHACAHSGARNYQWKNGRVVGTRGYICIRQKGHPRANSRGYVLEHILVWETTHNKALPKGWLIHHLNGIKADNRPENLVAMSKANHLHQAEPFKKRIRELEIKVKLLEKALDTNQMVFHFEEN